MRSVFNNLKYLHIVRGLAALVVVIFHAKFVLWVGGAVYQKEKGLNTFGDYALFALDMLSSCGEQCVIIFFILSAFVINHSFAKYKDDLIEFYKLRLFRIYIPFLFSIAFSVFILWLAVTYINPEINTASFRNYNERLHDAWEQISLSQVINTIFLIEPKEYAGGNYAYWSLGHELLFYILFPFYYFVNSKVKFFLAAIFLLIFLFAGWRIFYFQVFFLGGLLLYKYFETYSDKPVIKYPWLYRCLLIIIYIAINLSLKLLDHHVADVITFIFCFLLFDYVFYFVRKMPKVLMKLGDISYTLYLSHLPLLLLFYAFISLFTDKLVFYSRLPYYSGVIIALLGTIPLYLLVERPSIAILKKIRR